MTQLVIRSLEGEVITRLQRRARQHGRSTEEEVREILRDAVKDEGAPRQLLGSRLQQRFAGIGLKDDLPESRGEVARPPSPGHEALAARRPTRHLSGWCQPRQNALRR
jgi:antitoxin FitA